MNEFLKYFKTIHPILMEFQRYFKNIYVSKALIFSLVRTLKTVDIRAGKRVFAF